MHLKKRTEIPSLLKLIGKYYFMKEIKTARDLLYENFPMDHRPFTLRKNQRQGENKADNILKDIYEVLQLCL